MPAQSAERRLGSVSKSCEQMFAVPCQASEPLFGLRTFTLEIRPPGSGNRTKLRVSPDLGWEKLKEEHVDSNGTPLSAVTTVALELGEPAPSRFQIPASYAKVSGLAEFTRISSESRGHEASADSLGRIAEREAMHNRY
jgi:hypothetical protein